MLGFEKDTLQGQEVAPYLPILNRLLHSHHSGNNMRTSVECRGTRRSGEVFLAHVWLSTYQTSDGPGLAAVVWDASENLRDREGSGLDSMMATSRVLIGAISHEIRNLASAASSAYTALADTQSAGLRGSEQYQALGTLIRGLEKIASSGLARGVRPGSDGGGPGHRAGRDANRDRTGPEGGRDSGGLGCVREPAAGAGRPSQPAAGVRQPGAQQPAGARSGSQRKEVRISAAVESDLVVVRFRDSGPGVKHPEELFRPFQPGAHSIGLGLYISRAILRAHGGGLRYEPEDSGSCFVVELWPVENEIEG